MQQTRLRYCAIDSYRAGENGHPEIVMRGLLRSVDVDVLAVPMPIADAWFFWVKHDVPLPPMPGYITEAEWSAPPC